MIYLIENGPPATAAPPVIENSQYWQGHVGHVGQVPLATQHRQAERLWILCSVFVNDIQRQCWVTKFNDWQRRLWRSSSEDWLVEGGLLREVQVCCYTQHFMLGIEHKCGVKGDQDNDRIMSHLLSAAQIRPGASPCLILPFWLQAPSKRNTPRVVCLAVCCVCCLSAVVKVLCLTLPWISISQMVTKSEIPTFRQLTCSQSCQRNWAECDVNISSCTCGGTCHYFTINPGNFTIYKLNASSQA